VRLVGRDEMRVKLFMTIDFNQRWCQNCGAGFTEHFQPGPDADKNLAGRWCPRFDRKGFNSTVFMANPRTRNVRVSWT
jgi:hypothetical protein